jgi:hypothetical protein
MKEFESCLDIIEKMNELISSGATGAPKEFAGKICVCERTLYHYLKVLESLLKKSDKTLFYNAPLKTYQYSKPGKLDTSFKWIDPDCASTLDH